MAIYKITVVQSYLGQHLESIYHASINFLVVEPSQVPELVEIIDGYLNTFYPSLATAMSTAWSHSHYTVHLVVPGVGESLVAAPIFLGVGERGGQPLPPQNAAQTAVKAFMQSGTSKKFFSGISDQVLSSGSLSVPYQALFTTIAQTYASIYILNDYKLEPGWMSTAKVDGEPPLVPYFVNFMADSGVARPEIADLGKRKKGRGV